MATKSTKYTIRTMRWTLLFSLFMASSLYVTAENLKRIIDLEGSWRFSVGDNPAWADAAYNDQDWDLVAVPNYWENNGFADYNGYAWYRKEVLFQDWNDVESLLLVLGYIDDVDEVYFNGQLIGGMGVMPPKVTTAHRILRKYPLPKELINPRGKNVIAVRVFDDYMGGGIYAGPVGIFYDRDNDLLALNLSGYWNFNTQFEQENTNAHYYNQSNGKIYVPGYWESSGYAWLNGKASYSIRFSVPANISDSELMLVLGFIDDVDKVYLNQVRIGTVEDLRNGYDANFPNSELFRGYTIPPGLLNYSEDNLLEVTVYDTGGLGGIYEGPVGLIYADNFEKLNREKENTTYNFWDYLFKDLFKWD